MFDPDESVAKGAAIYANKQNQFNIVLEEIAAQTGKSTEELKDSIDSGKTDINELLDTAKVDKKFFGAIDNMKITNVSSRSFGTIAFNSKGEKKLFNIVLKNDELPAISKDTFFPMNDNQKNVEIIVMENLSTDKVIDIELGSEIGKAMLELPSGVTTNTEIEVTFKLNESGLLELKAKETKSNKVVEASFETKNAITNEEKISAMRRMDNSDIN
jgi:molecular chaperone DnaK (HSP70)